MQKQSITFQPYFIDDRDQIAVYSKVRSRHEATGLDYFAELRTSATLAIHGIADGIGEDMLHAAAVGRLEAEAYMHDVVRNMPLTLEAFEVLLEDFGNFQKLEQRFQYSEIQAVIDNDISGGSTGRYSMTKRKSEKIARLEAEAEARFKAADAAAKAAEAEAAAKAAEISITITADMIKTADTLDKALLPILKKWRLVSTCQLYAEGTPWEKIADILGYSNAAAAKMAFQRAKAKLKKAGIEAFLK